MNIYKNIFSNNEYQLVLGSIMRILTPNFTYVINSFRGLYEITLSQIILGNELP